VHIISGDYMHILHEQMDHEEIPAFLGGGCALVDDDHDNFDELALPVAAAQAAASR
jgi:hypothetical protein